MKFRTLNQLQEHLDHERSWRLKEIANLKGVVASTTYPAQKTSIRAGVPLLYAHWEGFVKQAANGYLNFVSFQDLRYEQLTGVFLVFGAKKHIHNLIDCRQAKVNIEAVDFFLTKQSEKARLSFEGAINTESNLSSKVFENIAFSLGIDISGYESKFNLIDESLLKRRNQIAHGEYLDIDGRAFADLANEVIILMTNFKTDIENAATLKTYLRPQRHLIP